MKTNINIEINQVKILDHGRGANDYETGLTVIPGTHYKIDRADWGGFRVLEEYKGKFEVFETYDNLEVALAVYNSRSLIDHISPRGKNRDEDEGTTLACRLEALVTAVIDQANECYLHDLHEEGYSDEDILKAIQEAIEGFQSEWAPEKALSVAYLTGDESEALRGIACDYLDYTGGEGPYAEGVRGALDKI